MCVTNSHDMTSAVKVALNPKTINQPTIQTLQSFVIMNIVKLTINPFPYNDTFWRPWETSLLKTLWEKKKLFVTSNFSFTHSVFYQFRELSAISIKFEIVVCSPFQCGTV